MRAIGFGINLNVVDLNVMKMSSASIECVKLVNCATMPRDKRTAEQKIVDAVRKYGEQVFRLEHSAYGEHQFCRAFICLSTAISTFCSAIPGCTSVFVAL
jgi:hypothetical protein